MGEVEYDDIDGSTDSYGLFIIDSRLSAMTLSGAIRSGFLRTYLACNALQTMTVAVLRQQLIKAQALRSVLSRTQTRAASQQAGAVLPSSKYEYIPGGPVLNGTVNDPAPFPPQSRSEGSHHWAFERLLSAALIPMTGAAFVTSGSQFPVFDGILAVSLVIHSHIGFDACLVDYLHPRKFPRLGPLMKWTLRAMTTGALVGVYMFNTNDIGLTELIRRVWTA